MTSHRFHRFAQNLLLGITSHRLHRCNFRGCTCLRSALPLARARSAPTKQTMVLPQIAQIYTEPSAGDDLPQIAQMQFQGVHLSQVHQPSKQWSSHRLHRSTQMVWVRKILPQIAQNSQNLLLGITSHRFHRFTQMVRLRKILPQIAQIYTEAANFRGCTCLRSALPLARTRSAPTEQYRYTPCYVGALETSAPP